MEIIQGKAYWPAALNVTVTRATAMDMMLQIVRALQRDAENITFCMMGDLNQDEEQTFQWRKD